MFTQGKMSLLRLTFITLFAGCFYSAAHAQEISQVDFTVHGSRVEITYDITACSGEEDYNVRLLLGHHGSLSEIKRGLSGDLEHVPCGSSNVIVWDVLSDRAELSGSIFFVVEISGRHVVTDDYPIANEGDDEQAAGAVPYGDPGQEAPETYRPQPRAVHLPPGILSLASWIAFEHARAAILSHGRPTVVFRKPAGPAFPKRKRP